MRKDLWVLIGPFWKIPCLVTFNGTDEVMVEVGAGLPLMDIQRGAAERLLEPMSIHKGLQFHIPFSAFKMVAQEAQFPEPELLLVWNPPEQVFEQTNKLRFQSDDANEFCRTFFETNACAQLRSITEVVFMFHAFCRHMFHFLMNEQKTVDLMFCKLHPHPFRGNWKHILYEEDTKAIDVHRRSKPLERLAMKYLKPQMFDWNRTWQVIEWQFEVEVSDVWRRQMIALERKRKEKYPGDMYFYDVFQFAKRSASACQALYEDFYRQIYQPYPGFPERWANQCGAVVPRRRDSRGGYPRVPPKDHRPSPLPSTLDPEQNPTGKPNIKGPKAPGVRKVRYLRPQKKKVRRRRKDVDKPIVRPPRIPGVSVCDAFGDLEP